jgi:predicted dehydrogenase
VVRCLTIPLAVLALTLPLSEAEQKQEKVLRAGLIGLDTSHVIAFTRILNKPNNTGDLAGVRVVAAYRGGSPDIPASANRLDKFTSELRDKDKIKIVDSIDDLLKEVDVVLLESVDGRPHLQQVIPVLKAGKLVFIDKPIAGSLADVLRIFALSRKYKTPTFSSSSYRFSPAVQNVRKDPKVGGVRGCDVHADCSLEPHHPDLFWYGIHGVETLFTVMGTGCQTVTRTHTKDTDLATGVWKDGRIGTFRGIRGAPTGPGGIVFGSKGIVPLPKPGGYESLVVEVCKFFKTGQPPVSAEETTEIFAFMEAADESKRQGGVPVSIESVLRKAQDDNRKRYGGE